MAETIPTFDIPDYNMPVVESKIAKLNKRAAKLGAEPIQIIVVKKWDKRILLGDNDDPAQFIGTDDITTTTLQSVKVIPVTTIQIIGKAPKLNGWTLVSVAEPIENGTLMRKFPGVEIEIPVEFRDVTPDRCDHCHTKRQRNETFVIHHENGEWKVVGRNCLADFTGSSNPEAIADYASALYDIMLSVKDDERLGSGGSGGYYSAPMRSFLRMVAIISGREGFVTATEAYNSENHKQATGKKVFQMFFNPHGGFSSRAERVKFFESITDEESERADNLVNAAMQWGKTEFVDAEENKLSDYGHNMKLLLAADYVRIVDVGFVASVIKGYQRYLERKQGELTYKGFVGEIGKKITIPVTVKKVYPFNGQYGMCFITTMQDDDGNVLTLFAKPEQKMEAGVYKVMTAKVKAHDERNGNKSTVVNYAKFI
jgi:hypothetical protein